MALLFLNELINYLTYKTSSIMYVDVNRGVDKLKVNIDIDISHIPCDLLSILTSDALGERSTDIKGEITKSRLDKMRLLCKDKDIPIRELVSDFNRETENGKSMDRYSKLLSDSIHSIVTIKDEKDVASLFKAGGTTALTNQISGLDDFELINFLVIK